MALANYSLPFTTAAPLFVSSAPAPGQGSLDDLLYSPEEHQHESEITHSDYRNNPFTPPATQRRNKLKKRSGISYLPPPNQFTHYPRPEDTQPNFNALNFNTQMNQYNHNPRLPVEPQNQRVHETGTSPFNTGEYIHDPSGDYDNYERRRIDLENSNIQRPPAPNFAPKPYYENPFPLVPPSTEGTPRRFESTVKHTLNFGFVQAPSAPTPPKQQTTTTTNVRGSDNKVGHDRQPGFTKVESGGSGGKTQLHAVLDYDDPDYYDDIPGGTGLGSPVTPLQGPILVKNGTVPVVPLYSYPTVNNGSFLQIPILWTALSLALGYELQGQVVKGIPCVKRNYQLYCPTAGNTYPLDKIETFIDENKALMKRMYGVFETKGGVGGSRKKRNSPGVPDLHAGDSYFRHIRQANRSPAPPPTTQQGNSTGRVDACESTTEITTPYWALNSARKVRAIVNTMHFEQAIHQEVCSKTTTGRCSGDCGCEQKYKWHRLLAYDPEDDCAGIFMDWFLFPSCCVCRCNP